MTPNLHNIKKDGSIFPSSGCLVASIYCTPLVEEKNGLRMHNLGRYILEKELHAFSKHFKNRESTSLETLLFEIDLPKSNRGNIIGTDYLRLGNIHYQTFKDLEYLLSDEEKARLKKSCVSSIKRSFKYLSISNTSYYLNQKVKPSVFLEMLTETIHTLPILGYLYFEVLSEYIMIYQDNQKSQEFAAAGEIYTPTYKEVAFALASNLFNHFSLTRFTPNIDQVIEYMKKSNVFKNLNREHFLHYMMDRLIFLTNARLLNSNMRIINWKRLYWDFDKLSVYFKPLMGHLIHRELRSLGRYPDFYYYFDQVKALQVWNYWNQVDIVIPFNGMVPKGEVGINPAYPNLQYKVYRATPVKKRGCLYLEPGKEQDIRIVPRLVDPRFTTMGENKKEEKIRTDKL
ncbi:hypothetical protein DRH14_01165 [Candidatus Shapirobacteria bacterium]|nr:MAG: hypothetical protein DRH14_01165 [Candidatus Shapirobacteria bacterium]